MKVFWSWQSDHPGRVSRHFVREALEKAISQMREDPQIEEAAREAELDHDRKGVPGSPDLARIILEKIKNSDVSVADVTPVGGVADNQKKRLINSNVAIELGFALGAVSDRALLMILNEAYGTREDLPFDLKHKAGPITYDLAADSTKRQIESEQAELVGTLKVALSEIVGAVAKGLFRPYQGAQAAADNPGRYFERGEILVSRGSQSLTCLSDHLLYVRIIPESEQAEIGRVDALRLCRDRLRPLDHRPSGISFEQNRYGVLCYESGHDETIQSGCQLFKTRELWGFNAYYLDRHNGQLGVPTGCHEESRSRKSAQDDKWSFCLTAGTLCPSYQERP